MHSQENMLNVFLINIQLSDNSANHVFLGEKKYPFQHIKKIQLFVVFNVFSLLMLALFLSDLNPANISVKNK